MAPAAGGRRSGICDNITFGDSNMSGLLGEILVEAGEITTEQLQEALEFQKENGGLLGEILVGLGYIQDDDIKKHLKDQWKYRNEAGMNAPDA